MERRELLLRTDHTAWPVRAPNLTYRVVLPSCTNLPELIQNTTRIWLVEKARGGLYLKACFENCTIRVDYGSQGEQYHVICGDMVSSNYVYFDKPTCRLNPSEIGADSEPWELVQLTEECAKRLAEKMMYCSPIVLSLEDALRLNKRVLRRCWPTSATTSRVPRMWRIFKQNASLSELAQVNGLDPYETSVVTALMDTGRAFSIKEVIQRVRHHRRNRLPGSSVRERTRLSVPELIPLGSLETRMMTPGQLLESKESKLTDFSIEHEAIVAALAREFRSIGLMPCFSPLIDLAVTREDMILICEVKTVSEDNFLDQVRLAIAQLLEYRFIYKPFFRRMNLALVAPPVQSTTDVSFARDFLRDCGIQWIGYSPRDGEFGFLKEALDFIMDPNDGANIADSIPSQLSGKRCSTELALVARASSP